MTAPQLHPHQLDTRARLADSIRSGHRCVMVQAPTAFGKTILAASIVSGAMAKLRKCEFADDRPQTIGVVVPAIALINQTHAVLRGYGIDAGVIQRDHPLTDPRKQVQVASVQTLDRRGILRLFDVTLIDEAHRWFKFYEKWLPLLIDEHNRGVVIGLSATPWTKGLGKWFTALVVGSTTSDLIRQGYLSDFRVYNSPRTRPDLSGVKLVAGDYHEGQLSEAMQKVDLIADVVATWQDRADGRPTIVFAVDRAHAGKLQGEFQKAGIPAGYIDMHTPIEDRDAIGQKLLSGDLKVVCNVDCLTIGVDWPWVSCVQVCRPTKSEMRYVQSVGRGLRVSPETGKIDCLLLDHSTTTENLGFVDDCYDRMTARGLDGGKRRVASAAEKPKRDELPRECSMCGRLRPPMIRKCPDCGFESKRQSELECEAGELIEARRKGKREFSMEDKQAWYGGLLCIAKERGYAEGWAFHKFKEKFGVGPSDLMERVVCEPTLEMRSWVKSRQIKWAKSKRRTEMQAVAP